MGKRIYNIIFNLHTVSGIAITIGLFIMFYAGAFTLFKDDIKAWERGFNIKDKTVQQIDFNRIIEDLDSTYQLRGRDIDLTLKGNDEVYVYMTASQDSTLLDKDKNSLELLYINLENYKQLSIEENYSLSEFLYELHFLDPILYPLGRYVAGFISLFLLLAIISGLLIHWKKIVPDFKKLNPKSSLKRLWANSHATLGILGIPYQLMYAVTGAFLILKIFVLLPSSFLYEGDQKKLLDDVLPSYAQKAWVGESSQTAIIINEYLADKANHFDDFIIERVHISNYNGENMSYGIIGKTEPTIQFVGLGRLENNAYTGEQIFEKNPYSILYAEDSLEVLYHLHFGNYGGYPLKAIYFILALISCFVIISGIYVWIESRNKKNYATKRKLFINKIGHIYIAICMTLLPTIALAFIFAQLTKGDFANPKTTLYIFFFTIWTIMTVYFRYKRDNYYTTKLCLLYTTIFGLLVPIANGLSTSNWIWKIFENLNFSIFFIDFLWIMLALICLYIYYKMKRRSQYAAAKNNLNLDYKSIKELLTKDSPITLKPKTMTNNLYLNPIWYRFKIIIFWILILIGYLFHYSYGIMDILIFKETFPIEITEEGVPMPFHIFRILVEGSIFILILLTLMYQNKGFKIFSLVWASILMLLNAYHIVGESMQHIENISLIFVLILILITNLLLIIHLYKWYKQE